MIELSLPPLRERREDIPLLCDALLGRQAKHGGLSRLNAAALAALQAYDFPGNVRELGNILERAAAFASNGLIDVSDLQLGSSLAFPLPDAAQESDFGEGDQQAVAAGTASLTARVRAFERKLIIDALSKAR